MTLNEDQLAQWHRDGFLHLEGFFHGPSLHDWTEELSAWPETAGKWMKYFESAPQVGESRLLCRIEDFLPYHDGWRGVIEDEGLHQALAQLFEEPSRLFKEKINFKLPGGSGFAAHQDAPAFSAFGQRFHITAMVSVDASHSGNGCLEVARGQHQRGLLDMTEAMVLSEGAVAALEWEPVATQPGDLLLFGSFLPHRSGGNGSTRSRRAAYLTYNGASDGDHRSDYYRNKRAVFPPEIERIPGRDYSDTGIYNVGNPIRTET